MEVWWNALNFSMSSFSAMDRLVEYILAHDISNRITIIGHYSGGQFVQRWSLLSQTATKVRSIVANPSSYAYLSPERWYDWEFRRPPKNATTHCAH